ncbi:MAG: LamG domain-containing protein [Candidatus Micrarchaeota archaeon]|nr:LamG domain-containing protein [Candidatus Micrarchaeota archaeon]
MRMLRAQSAMEYLMTYGWAIIIIAVALTALYSIGVFNGSAPKTQGGACSIVRPEGPGTSQFAQTSGLCNNEEPQFVASFTGVKTSNITSIPQNSFPMGDNAISVFAWVQTTQSTNYPWVFSYGNNPGSSSACTAGTIWALGIYSGHPTAEVCGTTTSSANVVNDGKWHFIGFTYPGSGTTATVYVDGASYSETLNVRPSVTFSGSASIGAGYVPSGSYFKGYVSNIQLYNTALSSNDVSALYFEGIGGAPINAQATVGWWQLNGGPQDYSGNIYSGLTQNVIFISTWTSGYTVP